MTSVNCVSFRKTCFRFVMVIFAVVLLAGPLPGQEEQQDSEKKEKQADKQPEIVTVQSRPLRIFEKFEGVVESANSMEIKTGVKAWSDLVIKEVEEEGAKVKAGQVVLEFDTEKIDDAIAEADFALKGNQLDFEDAKLVAEQARSEIRLDGDLNEREMKYAKDDYQYYQKVEREERDKDLEWSLRSANYGLEYAEEELDQLLKMYTEDELTEESEKIVLKRAQRGVESAQRRLEQMQLRADRQQSTMFPREDLKREEALERQKLKYEKMKATLPFTTQRAEIALKKSDFALTQAKEKWSELRADREQMKLKSPMDGILYHGRYVDGKWISATGGASRRLEPDRKIPARKVVLTVIDPERLTIRSEIPEDKIRYIDSGVEGTAILKADKSVRLPVVVSELKRVPLGSGKFECTFQVRNLENEDGKILPAMTCQISIGVYENEEGLVVPKASVFTDDGFNYYVYLSEDQRKDVEVGVTIDDMIEIKKGLSAGDKILKARP